MDQIMAYVEPGFEMVEASFRAERITAETILTPHLRQAVASWVALKGQRHLPEWKTASFLEFPAPLLPWGMLTAVEPDGHDYLVRYWGSGQSDLQNRDYTGRYLSEIQPHVIAKKCLEEHDAVIDNAVPLKTFTSGRVSAYGTVSFYKLKLPFGDEDGTVRHILSLEEPSRTTHRDVVGGPKWATRSTEAA